MGSSQQYSVHSSALDLKCKAFKAQATRSQQWKERRGSTYKKYHWRVSKKRSAFTRSSRRPINGVKQRIRTLKKLVPNGKSNGLEALFAETADYIKCLQMKVNIMQIMIKSLSPSD